MAKWDIKPDYEAMYNQLKLEHEKLKKEVNCDYYEAYLKEKLKVEKLERDLRIAVEDVLSMTSLK